MNNKSHSRKTKEQISKNHKGKHYSVKTEFKKGHIMDENIRKKISKKMRGRVKPESVRKKLSEAHLGMKKPWSKPPHHSGDKSSHWKGGKSPQYKSKTAPRPKPEQCEICGAFGNDTKKGLCYDHDHKTGKFRGWLCQRCNLALGMVKENTEILFGLIEYIKKHKNELTK